MQVRADHTPETDLVLERPFYSPGEVAELAGVSSTTVLNWIRSGELASVRLSERIIRIPRRALLKRLAPGSTRGPRRVKLEDIPLGPD
jgi:excisionase family DNA binding protein